MEQDEVQNLVGATTDEVEPMHLSRAARNHRGRSMGWKERVRNGIRGGDGGPGPACVPDPGVVGQFAREMVRQRLPREATTRGDWPTGTRTP